MSKTVQSIADEGNPRAPHDQFPATSTNWWLVVVVIAFTTAGLIGFAAGSQTNVFHGQSQDFGRQHAHTPLFN